MHYYTWSVFWGNPYTEPPAGMPRYLVSGMVAHREKRWSSQHRPPCIDLIIDHLKEPTWSIGCTSHNPRELPDGSGRTRTASEAGKQKIRRGRLRQRLEQKFPLLAEQMYADAIASKPSYYGKVTA